MTSDRRPISDLSDSEANQRLHGSSLVDLCWHGGNDYFVCPKCKKKYTPSYVMGPNGHLLPEENPDYSNDWNTVIPVVRSMAEDLLWDFVKLFFHNDKDSLDEFDFTVSLIKCNQRDLVNALLALCEDEG